VIDVSLKSIALRGFNESCADMILPCVQARVRATLVMQWKDPRLGFTVPSGYPHDYIKSGGGSYNGVRTWAPSVKIGESGIPFPFFSNTVTLIRKDGTVHMEMKTSLTLESRSANDKGAGETTYSFQIKEGVSPIDAVLLEWSKTHPLSGVYETAVSRPDEAGVRKAYKLDYSVGQCKSFIEYGDIGNMTTSCLEGFLKMTPATTMK